MVAAASSTAAARTSFFDEQRRRRRASWRLAVLVLGGVAFVGLIASTVVMPLLLALAGLLIRAVHAVQPDLADAARHAVAGWAGLRLDRFGAFIDRLDKLHGLAGLKEALRAAADFALFLLPGSGAMLLAYGGLRASLRRAGAEGVLLALGARPPRDGDAEERQLGNLVAEMAIAAGLPPPRLMLIDSDVPNAAALGSGAHDAVLLATRGLLDRLDRDETQGVVAHLVASIGDGDLRLTQAILALFETLGLFLTIIDLPFRATARRRIGQLLLLSFRRGGSVGVEAQRIADAIGGEIGPEAVEETSRFLGLDDEAQERQQQRGGRWSLRTILTLPLLPFALLNMLLRMVLWLWVALGLGLLVALLWRTRRYLADAAAVQLTRNPDGLARALGRIAAEGGGIPPGGEPVEYMFVYAGAVATVSKGGFGDKRALVMPLQPPLGTRLKRLRALGAMVGGDAPGGFHRLLHPPAEMSTVRWLATLVLVFVLLALLVPLFAALYVMIAFLTGIVIVSSTGLGLLALHLALG
ncbi:MAG TPA: M48 family metalloprotease [Stellaceae bacterium]